jgi:glycerol-3-phosphate acyltransferase PlsY
MAKVYDYVLAGAAGYLLGSVNVGVLLSKHVYKDDVRTHGSGNAGATNMARTFGLKAGAMTLGGDMLKGVASMGLGMKLCGMPGLALAGAACVAGHCWPVYYGFKGGKGVAVGAAVALMIDPRVFLAAFGTFASSAVLSKKVSVGSLCAAASLPVYAAAFKTGWAKTALACFAAGVVTAEHIPNIKRLIAHTEPNFTLGSAK